MTDTEIFYSMRPAYPWSEYPVGLPALGLVAVLLVALTLWTYLGHPQASRRRVVLVLVLRLLALVVALLTAVRPQVGIQEDPKTPSHLLVGIDLSETMSVRDEVNNQTRIAAVRKVLEKCEPILEELRTEQNVTVQYYGFGPATFTEANGAYDPNAPADAKKSDYGTYLARTLEKWQGAGQLRGHLVVGDGQDNGTGPSPLRAAEGWRAAGGAVSTFLVGQTGTQADARDVAITDVSADPSPVPMKTDFTLTVRANAYGFKGAKVPVKVKFDEGSGYKDVAGDQFTLTEERDNEIKIPLRAPDKPGEIKVRVEIPIESVPGDAAPANNVLETFLTVTKEGMRILIVNRLGFEHAAICRVLAPPRQPDQPADPGKPAAFALLQVIRQGDEPPTPAERDLFDFDRQQYDVLIVGNVSARQLTAIDPKLPEKIAEQVTKRGMGLLFTGGHATFLGTPGYPDAEGWKDSPAIRNILPVDLTPVGNTPADVRWYQYLPTAAQAGHYLNRLAADPKLSLEQWGRLNSPDNRSRFTGLSRMGRPIPTATVFALAGDAPRELMPLPAKDADVGRLPPLLVGHQIGDESRGRVLAFAAQDTYLWQRLGQPKSNDGKELHARFWRGLVRYLAHQEEDDGAAFARPARRRVAVRGEQTIEVGLRGPGGAPAADPQFEVKVVAPGEDEKVARPRPVFPAANGKFTLPYVPAAPGEYVVKVSATGKAADGQPVKGEATARFLAYPEASDEMLRTAADPEVMKGIAAAGGGKFYRLEELPAFLRELKAQPLEVAKPKPRYLPDWRRNHSTGFLPAWLFVFVTLLGTEWALRRLWGMV